MKKDNCSECGRQPPAPGWFNLAILILCITAGVFVGSECQQRAAYVTGFDAGVESMSTTRTEGHVFVELTIGCECGNVLRFGSDYPYEYWPFVVVCADCEMKYTLTREVAR